MRRPERWTWIALLGLACGLVGPGDSEVGTATSMNSLASTGTTGTAPTSGPAGSNGSEGSDVDTSESNSADTAPPDSGQTTFVPDGGGIAESCDPYEQDCPDGEKCMPYADDGGSSWNNDKCVPVMPNPAQVDEPCFAPEGGVAGIDNCDLGLMCWDVDAEGQGHCVALCSGSAGMGTCDGPCTVCANYNEGTLPLCLPGCDPIQQDCDSSSVCIDAPNKTGFLCVFDSSEEAGQVHDPCLYANGCEPGLICGDPSAAVECDQDATGCCEPYCDLSDPDADSKCPGVGQVCTPYFDEGAAPPCWQNIGLCAVPM